MHPSACTMKLTRRIYTEHDLRGDRQRRSNPPQGFHPKWQAQSTAPIAESLEEAGDRLFTFARLPPEPG